MLRNYLPRFRMAFLVYPALRRVRARLIGVQPRGRDNKRRHLRHKIAARKAKSKKKSHGGKNKTQRKEEITRARRINGRRASAMSDQVISGPSQRTSGRVGSCTVMVGREREREERWGAGVRSIAATLIQTQITCGETKTPEDCLANKGRGER